MTTWQVHVTAADAQSPQALQAAFARAGVAGRWRRPSVRVWLSGALARPFRFGPVAGLRGWAEAQSAAAAMAPQECGLAGPCHVWVESDPGSQASMATAANVALLDALDHAAEAVQARVVSVRPMWSLATERNGLDATSDVLLACRDADALTLLCWRAGVPLLAASYVPLPTAEEEASLFQRVQASTGMADADVHLARVRLRPGLPPDVEWAR